MTEQSRTPVVPSITKENEGENVQEETMPSNVTVEAKENTNMDFISINDFNFDLKPIEKVWESKGKKITIMPMTKGDRDEALKPINGQKIEASTDGSTKGFYISLELFDQIKQAVVCASLKHYVGSDGSPVLTKEKLKKLDNKSYEELSLLCLSVNKIDFFESNKSDVAKASEVKN
jgi:hypothetical protein